MNGRCWLAAVAVCGALYSVAWWAVERWTCDHDRHVAAVRQAERDSIVAHWSAVRTRDSVRLVQWAESVVLRRGDSLRVVLSEMALRERPRLPVQIRTVVERDTIRDSVVVAGSDLRVLLVSDSAQRVRADSLQGELDQCVYDLGEALNRPETPARWSWSAFGLGVGVGSAGAAAACLATR